METELILKQLTLLLVDDTPGSSAAMYSLLSNQFNTVTLAHDAERALELLAERPIDMVITDICLPGMDGLELIGQLRQSGDMVPVIVVSAHSDNEYLMRAANLQIDGFVSKPLTGSKLNTALKNALRRLEHVVTPVQLNSSVSYHPLHKTLMVDGVEVSLGSKESRLLEFLVKNRHRLVSKQEIYDSVWQGEEASESALKNLLAELRKKLRYDIIRNRHGAGWILEGRQG